MMQSSELLAYFMKRERFAYVQLDRSLNITAVSPNLSQLFPVPQLSNSQLFIGQSVTTLFAELVGAEAILAAVHAKEREDFRLEEIRRTNIYGKHCYYTIRAVCVDDAQSNAELLLIVEDITEEATLKQALTQERNELRLTKSQLTAANEQLRKLDQFKNLFLSMAAHDLRTPLFVISGYLQMMLMEPLSEEHADLVENAVRQIHWLDNLILDFLSVDKIERGELVISPASFDLSPLVQSVAALFADIMRSKRQTLHMNLPEGKTAVWGEEMRIRQILFNLLSNATKYSMTDGHILITVVEEANEIVLQIADSGKGLTADEQAKIFLPYYRTGSAQQARVSGTGLGLFITKMLVEAHGGTIAVQSELDVGTKFIIHLPQPVKETKTDEIDL